MSDRDELEAERIRLQRELAAMRADRQGAATRLQRELDDLRKQKAALGVQFRELQRELAELESSLLSAQEDEHAAERDLRGAKAHLSDLAR